MCTIFYTLSQYIAIFHRRSGSSLSFKRTDLLGCLLGTLIRQRRSPESYKCNLSFSLLTLFYGIFWSLASFIVYSDTAKCLLLPYKRKRDRERERPGTENLSLHNTVKSRNDKPCKIYQDFLYIYKKLHARIVNSISNSPSFVNGSKLSKVAQKYIIL